MTDDIKLPPLPRPQVPFIAADIYLPDILRLADWCEKTAKEYARAAVLADREAQQQDELDAARYRWLRRGGNDDIGVVRGFDVIEYGSSSVASTYEDRLCGDRLDAAIDHARRVEGEGE